MGSHWAAVASRPGDSPGKSSPVDWPKPRALTWLSSRCSPTPCAISEVPMLEDCARICVAVELLGGVRLGVVEGRPVQADLVGHGETGVGVDQAVLQRGREGHELEHRARLVELGHGQVVLRFVDGVVRPDRHDAAGVVRRGGGRRAERGAGWVATRLAMERIWPVFTSMTTAVPLTAFDVSIALASACSDSYWSWESRVSSRPGARARGHLVRHRRLRQRHAARATP